MTSAAPGAGPPAFWDAAQIRLLSHPGLTPARVPALLDDIRARAAEISAGRAGG